MSDSKIRDAVRQLAGTHLSDEVNILACKVDSVDIDARTCDCTAIGGQGVTEIPNVLLMAEVDDGFLMVPAVDSTVIVCYSKRNVPFVCLFSQIDQVLIIVGSSVLSMKDGAIVFNDGKLGGLINIKDLVSKMNTIEEDLNTIKQAFTSWTPVPEDGGAALKAATASWSAQEITDTQVSDIEDTKIKH